jgi:HSP20 family protein
MLNTVFSNDIRQTLDHFRRSVDQIFDNVSGYRSERATGTSPEGTEWTFSPTLESGWDENMLHLRAVLPGVRQKDVNVSMQGNQIVITGERKAPEGFAKNAYTQLIYGKFYTAVTLPNGLETERVNCQFQDGVLDISIPVAEAMKPRQIPIHSVGPQKTVEQQKTISA